MTSEDQKILFEKLGKQMNYTLGLPNFKLINDVIYKLCTKCKKYKPGRAYSLSNIRLVCNSINTMRSNLSDEEFLSFCKAVVDYLSI